VSLLQPSLFLWGLPFVLIPVLIHLINRMRYKELQWAAMMFLLKAKRSTTKMAKLREIIILLIRALLIFMLLLAFSKPLLTGWFNYSGPPEEVVIIFDRSQSMETRAQGEKLSFRQRAKSTLVNALNEMNPLPRVTLIDSATLKEIAILKADDIKNNIYLEASDSKTDMTLCVEKAIQHISKSNSTHTQIWIVSDSQKSNWRPTSEVWQWHRSSLQSLASKTSIRYLSFGIEENNNRKINLENIYQYEYDSKQYVEITFTLTVNKVQKEKLPIVFEHGGVKTTREYNIDAYQSILKHTIKLNQKNREGWGKISIPKDENELDNQCFFAWAEEKENKILTVSESKFVRRMLEYAVNDKSEIKGSVLQTKIKDNRFLNDHSLVIIHGPLKKII
jgi:hypothetical protein